VWVQEYELLVSSLASEYFRKYPMLEPGDIRQTLWMWFVTHPVKYTEWSKLPAKDKEKLIAKSLRNAATMTPQLLRRFCHLLLQVVMNCLIKSKTLTLSLVKAKLQMETIG
jgi:hypothetical protein